MRCHEEEIKAILRNAGESKFKRDARLVTLIAGACVFAILIWEGGRRAGILEAGDYYRISNQGSIHLRDGAGGAVVNHASNGNELLLGQ